jgi:MerR family transcriptional regulator/heat shock protein HspR
MRINSRQDKSSPLYMISVVSRILEVHPQTLRMYEREGFVSPHRINRQRFYSDDDIEQLDLIIKLIKELGVNKAGVDIILRMRRRLKSLHGEMMEMMQFLDDDVKEEFERHIQNILRED